MSKEVRTLVRSWRVGIFTCTLTIVPNGRSGSVRGVTAWHPGLPPTLDEVEAEQYRRGRNAAISDLARDLGVTVAVIEV